MFHLSLPLLNVHSGLYQCYLKCSQWTVCWSTSHWLPMLSMSLRVSLFQILRISKGLLQGICQAVQMQKDQWERPGKLVSIHLIHPLMAHKEQKILQVHNSWHFEKHWPIKMQSFAKILEVR